MRNFGLEPRDEDYTWPVVKVTLTVLAVLGASGVMVIALAMVVLLRWP
jgi:preprotein translocase subunit Sss1